MRLPWSRAPKSEKSKGDGRTPETAFVLNAPGTAAGIAAEYMIIEKIFGIENIDWRVFDRLVIDRPDGQKVEKFILDVRGKRREIYFDISSWHGTPSDSVSQEIVDRAIARAESVSLQIALPMSAITTLSVILVGVNTGPMKEMFDIRPVVDAINRASETTDGEKGPDEVLSVAMSRASWISLLALLRSVRPQGLLDEEYLEDLRAYIEGGLKKGRMETR